MSESSPLDAARRLRGRAGRWRESRLDRRFQTRICHDPGAPELLLSPHLDDAVLDCWALLSSKHELRVVNLFAGVPPAGRLAPWDAITGARDSGERVRERIAEDAEALAKAGREAINLPFLDAQYRSPPPAPDLKRLDLALSSILPRASRVYAPAGIGGHLDHMLARRYACALARAGMPVELYAELPYCVLHGWPTWVDGRDADPYRDVDAFWLTFLKQVSEMPALRAARVESLDDREAAAKLRAMLCYRTQMPALDYAAAGVLVDPALHRFEVRWQLRPAR